MSPARGGDEGGPEALRFLYVHPVKLPTAEANVVQAAETCRALAALGHEVFLIVPRVAAADAAAALRDLAVDPHPRLHVVEEPAIRLRNPGRVRSLVVRALLLGFLRALVRRGRTVFYFRTLRDGRLARFLLLAGRVLRVPVIFEAHKMVTAKRAEQGFDAASVARSARLENRVLQHAAGVVASHPAFAAALREGPRPRGALVTVPNGVRSIQVGAAPAEYDAVYAGSLFAWKGVEVCIDAIARLPGRVLAIAGGNPKERLVELRARVEALGLADRVRLLGQLPRDRALATVARARVALVPLDPGSGEGEASTFPLKLLEAWMLGVPVVAADSPALRAFATEGEHLLYYVSGDPASLAAAVACILDDAALAKRLAESGRQLAVTFSFEARALAVAAFARRVLEG